MSDIVEHRFATMEENEAADEIKRLRTSLAVAVEELASYRNKQVARRRESDDKYRESVDRHRAAISATDADPILGPMMKEIA